MSQTQEINQPRRILLIGKDLAGTEHIADFLKSFGKPKALSSLDTSDVLFHRIESPYYSASIPVWRDEVPLPARWVEHWKNEEGAGDVVRAVGAWIVCFVRPTTNPEKAALTSLLSAVSNIISHHINHASSNYAINQIDESDIVTLAVSVPRPQSSQVQSSSAPLLSISDADLEDICQTARSPDGAGTGWEYVDGTVAAGSGRRNEYGEAIGLDRLLEALKGGEWDMGGDDGDAHDLDGVDGHSGEGGGDEEAAGSDDADDFGDFNFAEPADVTKTGDEEATDKEEAQRAMREGLLPKSDHEAGDGANDNPEQAAAGSQAAAPQPQAATAPHLGGAPEAAATEDDPWRVRGKGEDPMVAPPSYERLDDGETDDDVELLQSMMLRLQAARDLGADLPAAQRRQLAARAVREVMKDF